MLVQYLFGNAYRQWRLGLMLLAYFLIIVVGAIPGARQSVGEVAAGWVLHAVAYSFLSALAFTSLSGTPWRKAKGALLMMAFMGGLDEYIQGFFSYRMASITDWAIDMAAALFTVSVLMLASWKISVTGR